MIRLRAGFHQRRFQTALERVLAEKKISFDMPAARFQQVSDRVFFELKPPFFKRMYDWILENWETVFKILMVVIPMFI